MRVTDEQYYTLLDKSDNLAVSPAELAKDWEEDNREWYHVTINEVDLPTLVHLSNLKWYASCRCHFEEDYNKTSNEHVHALVKFVDHTSLKEFKKGLSEEEGDRLHPRTVFRRIICLDHAVGVLHYISCDRGRNTYRGESKHNHYAHNVYKGDWLHSRSATKCKHARNIISKETAEGVEDIDEYESPLELHDAEHCPCDRGKRAAFKRKVEKTTKLGGGLKIKKPKHK